MNNAATTSDGGMTWIPALSAPVPFGRVEPNGLDFVDATHGWALEFLSGRLFKTVVDVAALWIALVIRREHRRRPAQPAVPGATVSKRSGLTSSHHGHR